MKALNFNELSAKYVVDLFIRCNMAESGPPIGTVLGNLGVNSAKFCKEFNDFTKQLPSYFVLKVRILIFENRTFSFFIKAPSTSFILNALRFEKIFDVQHHDRIHKRSFLCITFKDLIRLARFKFFNFSIKSVLSMLWSTVKCAGIIIIN